MSIYKKTKWRFTYYQEQVALGFADAKIPRGFIISFSALLLGHSLFLVQVGSLPVQ